jgi:hypothetical protein
VFAAFSRSRASRRIVTVVSPSRPFFILLFGRNEGSGCNLVTVCQLLENFSPKLKKTLKPFPPSRVFIDRESIATPCRPMSRHSPNQPRTRPQSAAKVGRALRASRPRANRGFSVPNPCLPPGWVPVKFDFCPRMSTDVHRCPFRRSPSMGATPAKYSFQLHFVALCCTLLHSVALCCTLLHSP